MASTCSFISASSQAMSRSIAWTMRWRRTGARKRSVSPNHRRNATAHDGSDRKSSRSARVDPAGRKARSTTMSRNAVARRPRSVEGAWSAGADTASLADSGRPSSVVVIAPLVLLGHLRDARHHPQRGGQLFHLQPRPQVRDRVIGARLAGNLPHRDLSLTQRIAGLQFRAGILVGVDVVVDPAIEPLLA